MLSQREQSLRLLGCYSGESAANAFDGRPFAPTAPHRIEAERYVAQIVTGPASCQEPPADGAPAQV